jgi:phosphonate transport system permease protein
MGRPAAESGQRLLAGGRLAALATCALLALASFASLDLHWSELFTIDSMARMAAFLAEFGQPALDREFLLRIWGAAVETLAMSALGTLIAVACGLLLACDRRLARLLPNLLRAIPELVWASLLLVMVGLGPFAGTLALAAHTSGVLARLFHEALQNLPPGPARALRAAGASPLQILCYASLPQALPQLVSYTAYRWENNIRAAAILGVVGAGGLGQLLVFHLGLLQMGKAATVILATVLLVVLVDLLSDQLRRRLS